MTNNISNIKFRGDKQIWYILIFLSLISMLVVYSAISALAYKKADGNTEFFFIKHTGLLCVGFVITYFVHRLDFSNYIGIFRLCLFLCIPLLIYTLLFGVSVGGARRWVSVMGFSIQTSDFVRLVLITNLSAMLARRQNIEYRRRDLINMVAWIVVIVMLLSFSSFSTSVILALTCFLLMWIGRVPTKYLVSMVLWGTFLISLGFGAGVLAKRYLEVDFGRLNTVIARSEEFLNVDLDNDKSIGGEFGSSSDQKNYALLAIAEGGIIGKGPGNSSQKNILPDAFSDFVYSIIIEEYGWIGGMVVLGLFIWLFYRGVYNIDNTTRAFTGLLSVGLTLSIVLQGIAHMFVNVGLVPVTGQTLPLISMGGTSAIFTSVAVGIILSVTKTAEKS